MDAEVGDKVHVAHLLRLRVDITCCTAGRMEHRELAYGGFIVCALLSARYASCGAALGICLAVVRRTLMVHYHCRGGRRCYSIVIAACVVHASLSSR